MIIDELPSNIIITLPKNIKWQDYEKELLAVKNGNNEMRFKVGNIPTKPIIGGRCYIVYDNYIRGWMTITGIHKGSFKCTTTGKIWDGNFITRSGKFNYIDNIEYTGFQGWRYCDLI